MAGFPSVGQVGPSHSPCGLAGSSESARHHSGWVAVPSGSWYSIAVVVGFNRRSPRRAGLQDVTDPAELHATPVFSIVTVTLNAGSLLDETIASVRQQTFGSYEHIVKDGGSSDGSFERALAVPRIRCIQRPDSGIYDAMNQALELCRGDYVLFLNAGDAFQEAAVLEKLAPSAGGGAGVLYSDYWHSDLRSVVFNPPRLTRFFLFRNTLCHQAWLMRRDVIDRIGGFDVSLRVAADHELLTRAVLQQGVTALHTGVLAVRYHGGGFSATNRSVLERDFRHIRTRHFGRRESIWYGIVLALSVRQLRSVLLTSRWTSFMRPIYVSVRNALYRVRRPKRHSGAHRA